MAAVSLPHPAGGWFVTHFWFLAQLLKVFVLPGLGSNPCLPKSLRGLCFAY